MKFYLIDAVILFFLVLLACVMIFAGKSIYEKGFKAGQERLQQEEKYPKVSIANSSTIIVRPLLP